MTTYDEALRKHRHAAADASRKSFAAVSSDTNQKRETIAQVERIGASSANRAPEANFTGAFRIRGDFEREALSRSADAMVNFTPGAR